MNEPTSLPDDDQDPKDRPDDRIRRPLPPPRFSMLDTITHLIVLVPVATVLMTITIVLVSTGGGLI